MSRRSLRRTHRAFFGTQSRVAEFLRNVASVRVTPEYRRLRWVSAIILILFAIQIVTGILLSLYYYPAPGTAYESIRYLSGEVSGGWFIRALHRWAAELLVVTVLLHLLVVFFRRAYRWPREYEWVLGAFLLPAVLAFRFTGRLLPWDTVGYGAARRGLEMLERVPVLGGWTATWLRGGEDMGANTLSRFFATHVLILPWLALLLIGVQLYLIRRHGLSGGDR